MRILLTFLAIGTGLWAETTQTAPALVGENAAVSAPYELQVLPARTQTRVKLDCNTEWDA